MRSASAPGPTVPAHLPARLLTAAETAEILNVSLRTVRRLIAQKKLAIVRVGHAVRIRPEALAALIGGE
jgi:excisionase family DNA binding protein